MAWAKTAKRNEEENSVDGGWWFQWSTSETGCSSGQPGPEGIRDHPSNLVPIFCKTSQGLGAQEGQHCSAAIGTKNRHRLHVHESPEGRGGPEQGGQGHASPGASSCQRAENGLIQSRYICTSRGHPGFSMARNNTGSELISQCRIDAVQSVQSTTDYVGQAKDRCSDFHNLLNSAR